MTPQKRFEVYMKYNGRCAYCGRFIPKGEFQIDHKERISTRYYSNRGKKFTLKEAIKRLATDYQTGEIDKVEANAIKYDYNKNNAIENLNPTCKGCNHYKGKWDLEFYRELMLKLHKKMEDEYLIKRALEYGIVEIKPWDGIFYFERCKDANL